MLTAYSAKWFAVYYFCLGILEFIAGWYCLLQVNRLTRFLKERTSPDKSPYRLRIFLRYFLVFTLPTLILSFFPFSLVDLAFSIWCLFMIYLLGSLLLRWESLYPLLMNQSDPEIKKYIRFTGATLLSLSGVMFLLFYRIVQIRF